MVALKASEVEPFLKNNNWEYSLILVYGQDSGLVSERCSIIVKSISGDQDDPFMQVKLDSADLAKDPARLADEVVTIPMFGGKRIIWIKGGNNSLTAAAKTAVEENNGQAIVIVEAGDLKKNSSLRKFAETQKTVLAIPCYPDTARDLDRLIEEEVKSSNLSITREAQAALHSLLGANRLASRGELKKLCLYALENKKIEIDDVEAVVGDASELAMDALVDAVALGNIGEFDQAYVRLKASGIHGSVIAGAVLRHFQWLQFARSEFDNGMKSDQIVGSTVPPIYFKRRPLVTRQIPLWTAVQLSKAASLINKSILDSRLMPAHLGYTLVSNSLLTLARLAVQNSKRRKR